MQFSITGAILGMALVGSAASAAVPEFLIFDGPNLTRTTIGGTVDTFTLSDEIVGGTLTPSGEIWVTSSTPGGNELYELYRLDDAFGPAPSLTLVSDQLANAYTGITFIGDLIYTSRGGSQWLGTIDPNNGFVETEIGPTGIPNVGGFAYENATDTLYVLSGFAGIDGLTTIDYAGSPPTGTYVGPFGFDVFHGGMDLYGDVLYSSVVNLDAGTFDLGRVNRNTGAFIPLKPLGASVAGPVALVVVPAPSSAVLLAIGGSGLVRRRR